MLRRPRVIPLLLIENSRLVKTIQFKKPRYLGDPINAIKIFNEKLVDEITILCRRNYSKENPIPFDLLKDIASEAFMPLSYGGNIETVEDAKKLFKIGFEKIIINTSFFNNPKIVTELSNIVGSQSVVVSIDYKKNFFGRVICYTNGGRKSTKMNPKEAAIMAEKFGAGELLLTSISHEGKMQGFDYKILKEVVESVDIPVIIHGGAFDIESIRSAIYENGASAVAAGSMFVYYGHNKGILINFPDELELIEGGVYKNV